MRSVVLAVLLVGVWASPQSPSGQTREEAPTSDIAPGQPQTVDGYTLEEMDLRIRRARIGLLSMMGVSLLGGVLIGIGVSDFDLNTGEGSALLASGAFVASGGLIGMMTTGGMLAHRKRKRRGVQEADYRTPRRSQWDLEQSRLVF